MKTRQTLPPFHTGTTTQLVPEFWHLHRHINQGSIQDLTWVQPRFSTLLVSKVSTRDQNLVTSEPYRCEEMVAKRNIRGRARQGFSTFKQIDAGWIVTPWPQWSERHSILPCSLHKRHSLSPAGQDATPPS